MFYFWRFWYYLLQRAYTRVDASNGNYLMIISYIEDLSNSGFDCQSWQDRDRLTKEYEQYLDQFERNCRASFAILRKGALKDRKQKLYQDEESMRQRFIPSRDMD